MEVMIRGFASNFSNWFFYQIYNIKLVCQILLSLAHLICITSQADNANLGAKERTCRYVSSTFLPMMHPHAVTVQWSATNNGVKDLHSYYQTRHPSATKQDTPLPNKIPLCYQTRHPSATKQDTPLLPNKTPLCY